MSEEEQDGDSRVRLRLSIKSSLYDELEVTSKALHVSPNSLAVLALSLGLRVFAGVANPSQRQAQFVENEATAQIVEALSDAGMPVKKGS